MAVTQVRVRVYALLADAAGPSDSHGLLLQKASTRLVPSDPTADPEVHPVCLENASMQTTP